MTARYRCPFCGSYASRTSPAMINHILKQHRMRLIEGLGLIEAFGTRKPLDPPPDILKRHPGLNPGVSGEGDS